MQKIWSGTIMHDCDKFIIKMGTTEMRFSFDQADM